MPKIISISLALSSATESNQNWNKRSQNIPDDLQAKVSLEALNLNVFVFQRFISSCNRKYRYFLTILFSSLEIKKLCEIFPGWVLCLVTEITFTLTWNHISKMSSKKSKLNNKSGKYASYNRKISKKGFEVNRMKFKTLEFKLSWSRQRLYSTGAKMPENECC